MLGHGGDKNPELIGSRYEEEVSPWYHHVRDGAYQIRMDSVESTEKQSFMFGSELGRAKKARVVTGPVQEDPGVYTLRFTGIWGGLWTFSCYR